MGLQWTLTAYFLYFEIGVVILLLLPFISHILWQRLFKSHFMSMISSYSNYYVRMLMIILSIIFLNSIWQFHKFGIKTEELDFTSNAWQQYQQKINKAQRNFYISGFTLFLWLVLNRLVKLISTQAQLQIDLKEANKNKANRNSIDNSAQSLQDLSVKLAKAEELLQKTKLELKQTQVDFVALKSDSDSTKREYQRLLEQYSVLQNGTKSTSDKKVE